MESEFSAFCRPAERCLSDEFLTWVLRVSWFQISEGARVEYGA